MHPSYGMSHHAIAYLETNMPIPKAVSRSLPKIML